MIFKAIIISMCMAAAISGGNISSVSEASVPDGADTHIACGRVSVDGPMRSIMMYIHAFTDFALVTKASDNSQAYFTTRKKDLDATTAEDMMVYATAKTATVWNISVYYPVQSSVWTLESQFIDLVAGLTEEFGEPQELKINGNGRHSAWFENEKGAVSVDITEDGQTCIEYYDSANVDRYFEEMK